MRKRSVCLMAGVVLFLLTACNINDETTMVENGTYVMAHEASEAAILPRVTISDDQISFTYDMLSSYLPVGTYTIEDHRITMLTDDKLHQYVFQIEGETLVFLENQSSKVKLLNDRMSVAITDQTVFRLQE